MEMRGLRRSGVFSHVVPTLESAAAGKVDGALRKILVSIRRHLGKIRPPKTRKTPLSFAA
jgi:hypothetical protein